MEISLIHSQFFIIAIILIISFLIILFSATKLANRSASDVRIIWYFFSLALVGCYFVVAIAEKNGVISRTGTFKGEYGLTLQSIMKCMLDINTDIQIFLVILGMIILPQILNYFFSGLFGCASEPIFIGEAFRVFFWSIIKSFVVAAGILFYLSFYGYFSSWIGWSIVGASSMTTFSIMLLMLSFSMAYLREEGAIVVDELYSKISSKCPPAVLSVQKYFTRNI